MKTKNVVIGSTVGGVLVAAASTAIYMKNRKTIPEGIEVVSPFFIDKFMGKWHEVARLEPLNEKRLDNVTVEFSLDEDGNIKVINSGYNYKKSEKETYEGRVSFTGSPDEGGMKISFMRPFYTGYNVVAIDKNYKYAMIVGRNFNFLWILSRETSIPDDVKRSFLQKARSFGFNTEELEWSEHKK